jgi:glutamate dehydrogenase (NAD(P)+)
MEAKGTTASVQGFGNVAQYAIDLYHQLGGKVVCVSSWDQGDQTTYAFHRAAGVDLDELRAITDRFGGIDKAKAKDKGYEVLPGGDWIDRDVDILIPAALENQITGANVERISKRVKIIAEGANGPTTPEADAVLEKRGVFVIPDFLANAGGVTCSYFEQVQCNMNYFWPREEVLDKLDQKMTAAYYGISGLATKQKLYMRDAAYVVAINRVAAACRDRGWV